MAFVVKFHTVPLQIKLRDKSEKRFYPPTSETLLINIVSFQQQLKTTIFLG